MFDSRKELLEKIQLGQDSYLELEEVRFSGPQVSGPSRDSIADELAAFANGHGGVYVMGVEDGTREIPGIPAGRVQTAAKWIRDACRNSIQPPLAPKIDCITLPAALGEEVPVLKVDIARSPFVHKSPGGYLHRIGDAKQTMSPEYLERLFQQRSQVGIVRFDEQIVPEAKAEDLSPALRERFGASRSGDEPEEMLRKLHMVRADEDGTLRPTVAGVLMAAEDPRRWLPNAYIQAVAYRGTAIKTGTNDPYQLDAADITGPLDAQITDACRFVARNMKIAAFKDMGRVDLPQYDMTAVFEAVVNAVAHRDYSIHGSKIRLRMFADRLEIYSPGAIANTMTVEDLPYLQASRNEVLTSLLAKLPVPTNIPGLETGRRTLMDKRGEGVGIVLDNSERLSGKKPEYRMIGAGQLLLTIYAGGAGEAA